MPNRFWVQNEVRRKNPDGSVSIYCRKCGREIIRNQGFTNFLSVTKCANCMLKEKGVINSEDFVLAQYRLPDSNSLPIPIDMDDSIAGGVLLLYPDEKIHDGEQIPQTGGIIGTVRSMFRTIGFALPKPVKEIGSRVLATRNRSGLFGPAKADDRR
jgi:hypothetical protein